MANYDLELNVSVSIRTDDSDAEGHIDCQKAQTWAKEKVQAALDKVTNPERTDPGLTGARVYTPHGIRRTDPT